MTWIKRIAIGVVALFIVLFAALTLVKHSVKFYGRETFANADRGLSIQASEGVAGRYGFVGVRRGDAGMHLMLQTKQWDQIVALWETARAAPSGNWREIGAVAESSRPDSGRLTISGGRGVRFTLVRGGECAAFDLLPSDFDRFERSSRDLRRYIAGGAALPGEPVSWADAFHATLVTFGSFVGIADRPVRAC